MKKVLVVYWSQTGQLTSVVRALCAPLAEHADVEIVYAPLQTQAPYPFPWRLFRFLDAFPESVHMDPAPVAPLALDPQAEFDLVIIAWQVWFLSPSQPITAFLQSAQAHRLLRGKPVVSVIACRNMWLMAHEKMKALLAAAGARLLDNVALVDRNSSLLTFVTTPRWMLTGNKGAPGGLLPVAGVREEDIQGAARFGRALGAALARDEERGEGPLLHGLKAVEVDVRLIPSEKIGHRSFMLWGALLRKLGRPGSWARRPVLAVYVVFLITLIISVVPLTMGLRALLRPLAKRRLAAQKAAFEQPSGSGAQRMREFT